MKAQQLFFKQDGKWGAMLCCCGNTRNQICNEFSPGKWLCPHCMKRYGHLINKHKELCRCDYKCLHCEHCRECHTQFINNSMVESWLRRNNKEKKRTKYRFVKGKFKKYQW